MSFKERLNTDRSPCQDLTWNCCGWQPTREASKQVPKSFKSQIYIALKISKVKAVTCQHTEHVTVAGFLYMYNKIDFVYFGVEQIYSLWHWDLWHVLAMYRQSRNMTCIISFQIINLSSMLLHNCKFLGEGSNMASMLQLSDY